MAALAMALLLSLSLFWAFTVYPDVGDSAASYWTWKLEYCASNKRHFTLEIVTQTLQNCSSTYSSETCFNTDYKLSKSLNFSLMVGNGTIKLYENNTVCDESNTQPEFHPKIIFKNQRINFTQGKNESIPGNHTKVNINFKCVDNGLNLVLQNTNKSWIDALEDCQKNHSSLVQISTDAVMDKVKYLLQSFTWSQTGVWIGLERSIFGYNTEWKWISGSSFVDSKLKQNVSAKNNPNNHCGMIVYTDNEIKWRDANCHETLPFICQSTVLNVSPCPSNMAAENSELSIDIIEEPGNNSHKECK